MKCAGGNIILRRYDRWYRVGECAIMDVGDMLLSL